MMNRTTIAIVTLLSLSSAALAYGATPNPASRQEIARAGDAVMSLYPASRYIRNANNCGADKARAAWGPNEILLGYGCYSNSNGS
jgi:hypothetical protein